MNIISETFKWFLQFRLNEIESLKQAPKESQENVLFSLLSKAQNTEWGRKYNFTSISTIEEYQKSIPISEHEALLPYILRMMDGEEDVLWPGGVNNFSKSSGTTARSKFIPVSRESLSDMYKAGRDEFALYVKNNPETKILEGKSIFIGGSLEKVKENPEVFCGDVSAIIMKNLPIFGEFLRTPTLETAMLADYEIKLERLADETIKENVTSIAGVPTWTLALLRKVLDKTGKQNILEVWPNLEVFFHGAVSFDPYRKAFEELISSSNMKYMEAYNASEGFFAIQDDLSRRGEMWLVPDYGIFYEFIPLDEYGAENAKIYTMAEVKVGINYAVIISTNAGLWRYSIGDVVMFTSLLPHRIRITGRTKHFINAFGEEVMIHNTDFAIKEACEKTGALIEEYTVAPVYLENKNSGSPASALAMAGKHEWVVEFIKEPESPEEFMNELDAVLRKVNSDYDAKRHKDIILEKPKVNIVPQGTFYKWMKSRGKLGGQNKVPRLSNSREYVESVLKSILELQ